MNLPLIIAVSVLKIAVVMTVLLTCVAYTVLLERKVLGFIQLRYGPNRVGPWGLLQPLADALKLLFKEDFTPPGANKYLFVLAPIITAGAAFLPFAVIPFAGTILPPEITFYGYKIDLTVASLNQGVIGDTNIGLLYIFAVGSLGVYGAILGGWSSNNKYSLLGGSPALRPDGQLRAGPGTLRHRGDHAGRVPEHRLHRGSPEVRPVYRLPTHGFPDIHDCGHGRMRPDAV